MGERRPGEFECSNRKLVECKKGLTIRRRRTAMSLAESMLAEFEAQAPITRKFLERLPGDRLTWKPHEKSMSAGQLALHIARVPGRSVRFVEQNPAQAPDFANIPQPARGGEILAAL